jgi:acyl-coenzyme A thioesterase PaaI-like protein
MPDEAPLTPVTFTTPARRELAAVLRDLVDAAVTAEPRTEDELRAATAAVIAVTRGLAGPEAPARGVRRRVETLGTDYQHRSVVAGPVNPIAPDWSWHDDGDVITAHGSFGAAYEGPAGLVHGGFVALVLDEFLGLLNAQRGDDALTGTLTVRYRLPAPLNEGLEVVARRDRLEGRRIVNTASLTHDGRCLADAEGVFVRVDQ